MDWLEISVAVDPEAAEAVAETMSRYVQNRIAIEQPARTDIEPGADWSDDTLGPIVYVRAYAPIDDKVETRRQQIAEALWHLQQISPIPDPTFRKIKQTDWEHAWKEHYHVLRVGKRIVIKPSWRKHIPQPGEVLLELDPGMAFGTGLHPTTRLCLQAIERHMPHGARGIDLGTGSGILAIAAAKLGAGSVRAFDVDSIAVKSARENVARNTVDPIVSIEHGSLDLIYTKTKTPRASTGVLQTFDFGMINILATVIIQLCTDGLAEIFEPDAIVIFAGLIDTQESSVREAFEDVGFKLIDRLQEKDWVLLMCRYVKNIAVK